LIVLVDVQHGWPVIEHHTEQGGAELPALKVWVDTDAGDV